MFRALFVVRIMIIMAADSWYTALRVKSLVLIFMDTSCPLVSIIRSFVPMAPAKQALLMVSSWMMVVLFTFEPRA